MNYQTKLDGTILTITVDLSKRIGPSASGKSVIIATSSGNKSIGLPDGSVAKMGLNIYTDK